MKPEDLWRIFKSCGLTFFTGVPDSTFSGWMSYLAAKDGTDLTNMIAGNECEAVAMAAGYHLATGNVGVVYMQNSGEGKTINPITSLADKEVYSIPMVLMIGWRGEPGKKDEPQHAKMGKVTLSLLDTIGVPYQLMPGDPAEAKNVIEKATAEANTMQAPVALIIRKEVIEKYQKILEKDKIVFEMNREEALKVIVDSLEGKEAIISTTGKLSRELFEYRVARAESPRDFYTVGSMGGCTADPVDMERCQRKQGSFGA
jgi:phosphonopyruvate decarboxylase